MSDAAPCVMVKIGGRVVDTPDALRSFVDAWLAFTKSRSSRCAWIHGGGAQVDRLQEQLGIEVQFKAGRRATSPKAMAVVEMVLRGAVNPMLVRALTAAGVDAAGLSGMDGGLVRCRKEVDLGEVGVPVEVDTTLLEALWTVGCLPVLAPVSLGPRGEALNVNADEFACAVAGAACAKQLFLVSDVPGIRIQGVWQKELPCDALEGLIASGEIAGGMIPKVRSAKRALEAGVGEVIVCGAGDPAGLGHNGTRLKR